MCKLVSAFYTVHSCIFLVFSHLRILVIWYSCNIVITLVITLWLYLCVGMYNAPFASVLWFLSVLMLSVYTGRYFDLRIYVAVTSPYSWESGRYKLVSEPRLWTSSVRPEGNSIVKRFATGTHESWLYIPTTSTELSISWPSFLWFLDPFHILSLFWFYEAFIPALSPLYSI